MKKGFARCKDPYTKMSVKELEEARDIINKADVYVLLDMMNGSRASCNQITLQDLREYIDTLNQIDFKEERKKRNFNYIVFKSVMSEQMGIYANAVFDLAAARKALHTWHPRSRQYKKAKVREAVAMKTIDDVKEILKQEFEPIPEIIPRFNRPK